MFGLFSHKPLLDEESVQWMFDCFGWALRNFDAKVFYDETVLVKPTNDFFPGQETTAYGKAELILQQVKQYAGMSNWPVKLVEEQDFEALQTPQLSFAGSVRGQNALAPTSAVTENVLSVTYQAELLRNPQALIANYAQLFGHYLGATTKQPPPGGTENWPHITELLGVFLGFGLMFANTAYQVRVSSCGSCQGPVVQRTNYLSQFDITYALAIFTVLKNIPVKDATGHLKKTLLPFYKKAVKDIANHQEELSRLQEIR